MGLEKRSSEPSGVRHKLQSVYVELNLKVFTVAIRKKAPPDENAKYVHTKHVNSVLVRLYSKVTGLRSIIE